MLFQNRDGGFPHEFIQQTYSALHFGCVCVSVCMVLQHVHKNDGAHGRCHTICAGFLYTVLQNLRHRQIWKAARCQAEDSETSIISSHQLDYSLCTTACV